MCNLKYIIDRVGEKNILYTRIFVINIFIIFTLFIYSGLYNHYDFTFYSIFFLSLT